MLCRNFKGKIPGIYNLATLIQKIITPVRPNGQWVSMLSSQSAGVCPVVSIVWLLNQLIGLVPSQITFMLHYKQMNLSRNKYQMHCTGKEDFTDIWIILNSCNIFLYFWKDYMNSAPYNTCVSSIGSYCKILW